MPRSTTSHSPKSQAAAEHAAPRLIAVSEVATMLGVSVRTVWRLASSGALPPPLRLSGQLRRWRESDVADWIAAGGPAKKSR